MLAIFCGRGQLLTNCADLYLRDGGAIGGVLSDCLQVAAWADKNDINQLGLPDQSDLQINCDVLFSIGNPWVIPVAILGQVRAHAINVHDGPLPQAAGSNAPAWAILSGQTKHAVTWHLMTNRVNAGDVVASAPIAVSDDETAFSLNMKCFEAAENSFSDITTVVLQGTVSAAPQQGDRVFHARAEQPTSLGAIDPTGTVQHLSQLLRATDFGTTRNTFALSKLRVDDTTAIVGKGEILDAHGVTGSVLSRDDESVVIALCDGAVRLSDLTGIAGKALSPAQLGLSVGKVLTQPPETNPDLAKDIARAEMLYRKAFDVKSVNLPPFPVTLSQSDSAVSASLNHEGSIDDLVAAWVAWLSGMTGETVALALGVPQSDAAMSDLRPVSFTVQDQTAAQLRDNVQTSLTELQQLAPPVCDIAQRASDPEQAQRVLSVVFAEDTQSITDAALRITPSSITARGDVFSAETVSEIARAFDEFAQRFLAAGATDLNDIPTGTDTDLAHPGVSYPQETVHAAILRQARKTPQKIAIEADGKSITYEDLDQRSGALALALVDRGAKPGKVVGLCIERGFDLIIAQLAILRTGAAYLPLDPGYPVERIQYMIEDSATDLIVASGRAANRIGIDPAKLVTPDAAGAGDMAVAGTPDDMACLIYTSGSTGKPKGVMVPHRTIVNFMTAMDEVITYDEASKLLAVTSVCFDISKLELFWTLSRGVGVVLQTEGASTDMPGFSLFYFASETQGTGHHAYRLLLEGAKFADENGFEAIWTPERHFHAFGGLYPNPTITSAAVAAMTKNVHVRAGSFVAPLHHPVRAAEDWALVDNLSNGRAGIAFASGWQPNDFVTRPESFEDRKQVMIDNLTQMRALWRGETHTMPGHDGKDVTFEIHPKPVRGDIPTWLTVAGNPDTFAEAGRQGCNVLTHLLGQSFEEVSQKLALYRDAWRDAGHPGMGKVTMMLHTFISDDDDYVLETARAPMKQYLRSSVDLLKRASWSTPLIVEKSQTKGMSPAEMFEQKDLTDEEMDALLDHAFERYYKTSGLFGTPESAKDMVRSLTEIGVDEIACLIDFGIDTDVVMKNLPNIKALMREVEADGGLGRKASLADLILDNNVTHFQCTPPMASFLAADELGHKALSQLDVMMVGGEAFPPELARDLKGAMTGTLLNMYGPTETTIWSSVFEIADATAPIELGAPVANTVISIRSAAGRAVPTMVEGELWIGGAGVTDGYWQRPDLTAERFVDTPDGKFYRTGDLARRMPDGRLEFLGRLDSQVKVRGYRIELGEIEARLSEISGVRQAVVSAVQFGPGDLRLIGYVTGDGAMQQAAMLSQLAANLPEFMLPSQIITLDAMPLTPNGKIDRKALPHPKAETKPQEVSVPEGALEETISAIWRDALGLDQVSTTANFFDLGGHSLLTVQVQRRITEALGRDVSITDVFRYPTIRSLSQHLAQGDAPRENRAVGRGAARAAARLARRGGGA